MKSKAFRLSDEHINALKEAAKERGCSETDVIRACIDGISSGKTKEIPDESPINTLLADQLRVKDEQIAALTRALEAAQDTARTAQALEAKARETVSAVPRLVSADLAVTRQKGLFQRLRDAWKG